MPLRRVSLAFVVVLLSGPSMTWAGQGRPGGRDAPGTTMAPVVMRPFGPASIARAVAVEIAAQAQGDAEAPTRKKRDRVWNGVLIGAGVGAVVGVIAAAGSQECHGDDCFYAGLGAPPAPSLYLAPPSSARASAPSSMC